MIIYPFRILFLIFDISGLSMLGVKYLIKRIREINDK